MITAPYNFVPPPKPVNERTTATLTQPADLDAVAAFHSGWIDVTLRTLTPTHIRAGRPKTQRALQPASDLDETWADWGHKKDEPYGRKEFFHHGDPTCPIIPGSEVRGLLRTMYAILSGSAFHTQHREVAGFRSVFGKSDVAEQYRSLMNERVKAGFLFTSNDGSWVVLHSDPAPVDQNALAVRRSLRPGQTEVIYVDTAARASYKKNQKPRFELCTSASPTPQNEFFPAVVVNTGQIPRTRSPKTKHPAVLITPSMKQISVPNDVRDAAKADLGRRRAADEPLPTRQLPTLLPTVPASGSIKPDDYPRLVPCFYVLSNHGDVAQLGLTPLFRVLSNKQSPAEGQDSVTSVFGSLQLARAGRISVSSFHTSEPVKPTDPLSTEVMLEPKPTAATMYRTVNANADRLDDLIGSPRGWKFYWHRKSPAKMARAADVQGQDRKFRSVIRPVPAEIEFVGTVRFQSLNRFQLALLCESLEMLGGTRAAHIGLAKKFGLGSVRVTINSLALTDHRARSASFFAENGTPNLGAVRYDSWSAVRSELFPSDVPEAEPLHRRLFKADLPRIEALEALLEFKSAPPPEIFKELGGSGDQVPPVWTDRWVLDDAVTVYRRAPR